MDPGRVGTRVSLAGKSVRTRHRRVDHSRLQENAEGAQAMLPPLEAGELKRETSWRVWPDWHSGHRGKSLSWRASRTFSKTCPHPSHWYSKIGIPSPPSAQNQALLVINVLEGIPGGRMSNTTEANHSMPVCAGSWPRWSRILVRRLTILEFRARFCV